MHDAPPSARSSRLPLWGLAAAVAAYLVMAVFGLPQHGRDLLVRSHAALAAGPADHPAND